VLCGLWFVVRVQCFFYLLKRSLPELPDSHHTRYSGCHNPLYSPLRQKSLPFAIFFENVQVPDIPPCSPNVSEPTVN
jgi:hypothetical protein